MPPELYGYHSRVLIDFFLKLKSHRLPVSIKEYYRNLDDSVNSAHAISRSLWEDCESSRARAPRKEQVMMPKMEGSHGIPGRNQS
jgi:hypothetical protein